ncbi:MAG: hypothetical protein JRF41_12600, partial [Deltaproteobacteria bacterium]|nr:hypothetical protein [Deltaproteobacteria bacterium]
MLFKSKTRLTIFIFGLLLLFSTGCAVQEIGVKLGNDRPRKGRPPAHAPAHGHRAKHVYRYYPSAEVYFDISRGVYFYFTGVAWKVSVSLPSSLKVKLGNHVSIEMDTDKPYRDFKKHKAKYPHGWSKKKK